MKIADAVATGRGRCWRWITVAALLIYGGPSPALGLGEAQVESAFGQRLAVILPVHNTADTGWPQRCGWRLADPPARGGGVLDRPRLEAGERSGRPVLTLSTAGSVREPVVEFTVELACGSGYRLVRDYAILLDPPTYGPSPRPAPAVPEVLPAPPPAPVEAGDGVTVNPGDTLSAIVERHYPRHRAKADLARTIVAGNPRAFRDGDPDRLLAGARLTLPAAAPGIDDEAPPPLLKILPVAEEQRLAGMRMSEELDPERLAAAVAAAAASRTKAVPTELAQEAPPSPGPAGGAVEEPTAGGEKVGQVEAELAETRKRMAAMASEMASLQAKVQSLATTLREERTRQRDPPGWVWLVGAVLLVLLLAVLLAWLARRREGDGEMPIPVDDRATRVALAGMPAAAPLPSLAGQDLPSPATEIREALARVPAATEAGREVPRSTEQTQEIPLELMGLESEIPGTTVEAEFLNLMASEAAPGEAASAGGISEEQSRQLNRSVTVRLLEVELHLLYEQYGDALEVLRDLIDRESPEQPDMRPWSMAFFLYRQMGDRQAFDDLERCFRARYNVVPPGWEGETPAPLDLETRYPHLVARISALWDSPTAEGFLNGLLLDDREGKRAGFEMAVAEDISFLRELLAVRQEGTGTFPARGGR